MITILGKIVYGKNRNSQTHNIGSKKVNLDREVGQQGKERACVNIVTKIHSPK
jgi:hypothetical protein